MCACSLADDVIVLYDCRMTNKGPCPVNEGPHTEIDAGHDSQVIGDEIVTFARIECSACGQGLRNEIYDRRKND